MIDIKSGDDAPTILIIEDEPDLCEIIREICQQIIPQANVIISHRIENAKKTLITNQIDLIISDYYLPDGTGLEIYQTVKASYPNIRYLFCSSRDVRKDPLIGEDNLYGYVIKPDICPNLEQILNRFSSEYSNPA